MAIAPSTAESPEICARFMAFGSVGLMHSRTSPLKVTRSRSDVAGDPAEILVLPLHASGEFLLRQGRSESRLGRQETRLVTGNDPYEMVQAAGSGMGETYTLSFPAEELRRRVPGIDTVSRRSVARADAAFVLLERYLLCLAQDDGMDTIVAQAAGNHIADLVCLAFARSMETVARSRAAVQSARKAELRQLLARNATNPALTVSHLAERTGLATRTVQSLFEADGTSFSLELRRLRIERAVTLLGRGEASAASIADIAFACGFADISTFNRSFRAVTGLKPSDLRRR